MSDDLQAEVQRLIERLQAEAQALSKQKAELVQRRKEVDRLAYTTTEAAEMLGVSRAHIYNEMARGNLASVTLGRTRRILREELLRYLNEGST